jgi:mannose-1-phosphate guanylyltransferase
MVLCAGLGTRLRPLTDRCAKPLVPVGDRPALAHIVDRLRAAGVSRVVVNAHHHLDMLRAFVSAHAGVALSEEPELLGTAGGVARAHALLGEGDVLVYNGDIQTELDVRTLEAAHRELGAPAATLVLQPLALGEGSVGLGEDGRVVRLRGERFGVERRSAEFLGIHIMSAGLRRRLPERGGLIEDVLVPALARGEAVGAMLFEGAWRDIGTVAGYLDANAGWLAARGLSSWVAPGAHVGAAVTLDGSVVGAGASVEGQGAVRRCVVWPGARARGPLERQVVTS